MRENELRIALEACSQRLDTFDEGVRGQVLTPEQQEQRGNIVAEANGIIAEIKRASEAGEIRAIISGTQGLVVPPGTPAGNEEGLRVFRNLGEQLQAIKGAALDPSNVDARLVQLNNESRAALGANAGIPSEGGFAIQTDFAGMLMASAASAGNILPLADKYEISGNSDRVRWVDIDETSVATTVFGGVLVYWAAEAAQVTATKPKLVERELSLQKLMGVAYATYELEQDSNFISQLYTKAFTLAIQRELESCVVSGTGVGKPLGILKGGSLVQIAKEAGQVADTIVWENLSKMYHRALDKTKMAWVMHPDCHEQLDFLSFPVGVGGVPVYLPATAAGTIDTLRGKVIIESDQCSELGDLGDINFVDLSQYLLITKGGVQAATSMHVQFLTAENCFRFIFRANGMPKKNSALTIKNSAKQRSSFVALAARA